MNHAGEPLTEMQLGRTVFERGEHFNPAEDNIVRVQARQLRLRLEEYFRTIGKDESLLLEIPRGGYVPVFVLRGGRPEENPETPVVPQARASRWASGWGSRWASHALVGLVAAVLTAGAFLMTRPATTGGTASSAPVSWILAHLFAGGQSVKLVSPDSSFGLLQGYLPRNLTLEDYLGPGYPEEFIRQIPDGKLHARAGALTSRPYTTYSDLLVASAATAFATTNGWKLELVFARNLTPRDVEQGNLILMGSPKSNPWTSIVEEGMEFQSFYDSSRGRGGIRNLKPRGGEPSEFVTEAKHGYAGEAFALVVLRSQRKARTMSLAGTNMEGTEAAWGFVSSPRMAASVLQETGLAGVPEGEFDLELVLSTRAMAGTPRNPRIVALRLHRR